MHGDRLIPTEFPGNHQNTSSPFFSWATVLLTDVQENFVGQCGNPGATIIQLIQDLGIASFSQNLGCADIAGGGTTFTFKVNAISCFMFSCEQTTIATVDLGAGLNCPPPPTAPSWGCEEPDSCDAACLGPGGLGGGSGTGGGGGGSCGGVWVPGIL